MKTADRQQFLKQTGALVAGTATFGFANSARAAGANEKVVMAIIGPGGMVTNLLKSFAAQKDVEIGHLSAARCHLGNIATRVGRTLHFSPKTEQIEDDEEAKRLVRRTGRDGHPAVTKGV